MKRVFITGIAGFIGSHLAKRLEKMGHFVTGCDNFNSYYDPSLKRARIKDLSVHELDICQTEAIEELVTQEKITRLLRNILGALPPLAKR